MKILIADSFPEIHRHSLGKAGHLITFEPALDEHSLAEAIADHEVLIVRSTKVTAATLESGSNLKLVVRAGAGTNTIDKPSARELGVNVCNVPGANAAAVAELAMGLIISIDRQIPANVQDLKNHTWNKKKYAQARGLYGRKLGILGVGAIGLAVADRARAFGMEVFAVEKKGRAASAEKRIHDAGIQQVATTEELLALCDIISLHLPANDATTGMVNAEFLRHMKHGAILINTSRGELIDEQALIEAMDNKEIRAGVDVYNNEPGAADDTFHSSLATHARVCGTHHIGASTEQAQDAVASGVLDVIKAYEQGNIRNCVNCVNCVN